MTLCRCGHHFTSHAAAGSGVLVKASTGRLECEADGCECPRYWWQREEVMTDMNTTDTSKYRVWYKKTDEDEWDHSERLEWIDAEALQNDLISGYSPAFAVVILSTHFSLEVQRWQADTAVSDLDVYGWTKS